MRMLSSDVSITVLAVSLLVCGAPSVGLAQEQQRSQVIRVTLRVRDLSVNPRVVRPGPVTVIVENHTMMANPVIVIRPRLQAPSVEAKRLTAPERSVPRKGWFPTALTPGEHLVTLEQDPNVQAVITVKP